MAFTKITENDIHGLGVTGLPDVPGLTTEDMQKKLDELASYAIRRINLLMDELAGELAAGYIGSKGGNVQEDIERLEAAVEKKAEAAAVLPKDNTEPYTPTGSHNPATKGYVDGKVVEIGAGDMAKAVYDPTGRKSDIFAAVDEAKNAADAAGEAAAGAQTTADGAMPKSGGTFAGDVKAVETNRDTSGGCLRNIAVCNANLDTNYSTNKILMARK